RAIHLPFWLRKNLSGFFASETSISLLIACVSVIVITLILSFRYISSESPVQENISTRDIYAEKTFQVEDQQETQKLRYESRENVAPSYQHQSGAEKLIIDRVINLMEDIDALRTNSN